MPVSQGPASVKQEMHKFKAGELHSGSKSMSDVSQHLHYAASGWRGESESLFVR